uniref:Solute carrier family 25 member 40 n=1 Tax=Plectus sambesii TaxID=2011161 RepID=A0A914W4K2_9BILA
MEEQEVLPASSSTITVGQQALASCCGAIVTSLFVTPLDVVKIRLQTQGHPLQQGKCFLFSNGLMDHLCLNCAETTSTAPCEWYNRPGRFSGTLDAFVKIARHEGVRSLWSGLSPTIVMAVPATVFYFALYDNLLLRMRRRRVSEVWAPMVAGGTARVAAVTLISPLEMIRTKLQSEKLTYKDVWRAVSKAKQSEGWLALWRGWGPTILRDLPFSAIYWSAYEYMKKRLIKYYSLKETTFSISFASGAVAGSLAALCTLPFDVVKTHRQVAIGEAIIQPGEKALPTSTWTLMRTLARERGIRSLFSGSFIRSL